MKHPLADWLALRGFRPRRFQQQAWRHWAAGRDVVIGVATGAGKTLAAVGGCLADGVHGRLAPGGPRLLVLAPLRATVQDLTLRLQELVGELLPSWRVADHTGDTAPGVRQRQRRRLPEILLTTPESLALLLTHAPVREQFRGLAGVVVDEWHELAGGKRGALLELNLAELRHLAPGLRHVACSATFGDPAAAGRRLVGPLAPAPTVVQLPGGAGVDLRVVLPPSAQRIPWGGRSGLRSLPAVLPELQAADSSLVFCNVRSHAERWFAALQAAWPAVGDGLALHHGSVAEDRRQQIVTDLRGGRLRCVVCTASLDLGVDFGAVDLVVQVGAPHGLARLVQRAGRARQRRRGRSRLLVVPTHACELLELVAARRLLADGQVESMVPLAAPEDVLVQHLVSVALAGPVLPAALYARVRDTVAFADLTRADFEAAVALVVHGGASLRRYADHHRVDRGPDGLQVTSRRIASRHRMNIGTITSDPAVLVRRRRRGGGGAAIGQVEESFAASLFPGQVLRLAGAAWEVVGLREDALEVRPSRRSAEVVPRWLGGRLPLSDELATALRELLGASAPAAGLPAPVAAAVRGILAAQARLSRLPGPDELLIEHWVDDDGGHLVVLPCAGRRVHTALATLLAWRLGRRQPLTVSINCNDYGFELYGPQALPAAACAAADLWSTDSLAEDLAAAVNLGELARRRFRDIARIAGLVPQVLPGMRKGARQVQASAGLLYDVFVNHDPDHLLLRQARREVDEWELDLPGLRRTLARCAAAERHVLAVAQPGPLALPLVLERLVATLSSEDDIARLQRLVEAVAAGGG